MHDNTRHFIVTTGRTGSTFLCATLASAGAGFGMGAPLEWSPNTGDLETEEVRKAGALLEGCNRFSPTVPGNFLSAALWRFYQKQGWTVLRKALDRAQYLKGSALLVQPSVYLGYVPRVILNYRRLETQIASQLVRSKYETADYLVANYNRVMRNGLAAVKIFGGCVVSYEEMQNSEDDAWIHALAGVTELAADPMIAFRNKNLRQNEVDPEMPTLCIEADRLWKEAELMRGQVFMPLRQASRAIQKRAEWRKKSVKISSVSKAA